MIIQPIDSGNKAHPYGHALVAGIERYPLKITRRMSKTRQDKRSKVKPFIKIVNYNHLMPTRYTLELEGLKGAVSNDTFKEVSQREEAKKTVKKVLEERYTSGKNRWFFTALSMSLLSLTLGLCSRNLPVVATSPATRMTAGRRAYWPEYAQIRVELLLTDCPDRILIVVSSTSVGGGANGFSGCTQHQRHQDSRAFHELNQNNSR